MSYTTEGYIGSFVLPMKAGKDPIKFRVLPASDYLHETSTSQKILLIDGNKALLADIDAEFSVATSNGYALAPTLVALKTSKAKVCLECDTRYKVSKITVL